MSSHVKERNQRQRAQVDLLDGGVDVLDGPSGQSRGGKRHPRQSNPFEAVWNFLTSMRTGLMVILILGVLTLIGTLVMQVTPEAAADPVTYQQWYEAGPQQKYGGWAPVLRALGLYNVFGTWYFRALFAFLAVSILACSVNRAPRLWRTATRPRVVMNEAFYGRAPLRASIELPMDAEAAAERVRAGLRKQRLRVVEDDADGNVNLYADRFRWGPFGTVVAHLSFVIILAGFVVSASMGFRDEQLIAPIGVPVEVGHGTGLTVLAHSFNDDYYEDGSPKDYVSDIELFRGEESLARQNIRVNEPLIFDDIWFHQSFFGVGADISVTDAAGAEVFAETVALGWRSNDGTLSIGQFDIPAKGLSVEVLQAASGQVLADLPAGSIALRVYGDGQSTPTIQVLNQGGSTQIEGLTWTFERNRQYTGITVKRDPGSNVVWVGTVLLILGSTLVFFLPHRRVWVRVSPAGKGASQVLLGAPIKRDPGIEPVFADLVDHIRGDEAPESH